MTITPDSLRRNLSDLSADASRANRSADEIIKAAGERRDVVTARMDELRPKTLTDPAAADEYGALVHERGQLDLVIGGKR
jgi:hypothetical protein